MLFKNLLLVGLGGGAGSMLRYLTSFLLGKNFIGNHLPLATLFVNLSGCLLMGLLMGLAEKHIVFQNDLRYLLAIGFCGGYTTFSAFAAENFVLLQQGNYWTVASYIVLSVALGITAFFVAYQVVKMI